MRNHRYVAALLFWGAMSSGLWCTNAAAQAPPWDTVRIIVEFRERIRIGDVDSLLGGNGFVAEKSLGDSTTYLVHIPKEWTIEEAVENVMRREPVEYAGANLYCRLPEAAQMSQAFLDADSDPFVSGMSPGEYYTQYAMTRLAVPSGQQMAMGDGQLIALVDNGVDFAHPALSGVLSPLGFDYLDSDPDPGYEAGEFAGHGTFSAGLLVLGAPHAMILPIRALDGDGRGTVFDICMGIEHAVSMGSGILCLGFSMGVDDRILRTTVARADSAGVMVISPAGNDSAEVPSYPAAYPFVIGVGAIDSSDVKAGFSNFGVSVDVCAPGVEIYSALPGGDVWGRWNGTSFAAPLAAALSCLVRELHPSATVSARTEIVQWTSVSIDAENTPYAGLLGHGRVDYARATGFVTPVVAIWGVVTDAAGIGHADVVVEIRQDGSEQPYSTTLTDSTGGFVIASDAGLMDLSFIPPTMSGHLPANQPGLDLWNDTMISAVLAEVRRGDFNDDAIWDVQDVVGMIEYVFRGSIPPAPEAIADLSCDGTADVVDVVGLINFVFRGGEPSVCP